MPDVIIRCPSCHWKPDDSCRWMCEVCNTRWNTFHTGGTCPGCGKVYADTQCFSPRRGGCGQMSAHEDWYEQQANVKPLSRSIWFWKNKNLPPITAEDKLWVEQSLVWLTATFSPDRVKKLKTITPDLFTDRAFTAIEEDAIYVFERLISLMEIEPWDLQLKFYTEGSTTFSDGTVATPSGSLKNTWKSSLSKYENSEPGQQVIWVDLKLLQDVPKLIATLAHELSHYKLWTEVGMDGKDGLLIDLTAIMFGFGIFSGNSYFRFVQWMDNTHQGWQIQKGAYLPEQVIAYAMAWLAHYRVEDITWKHFLNRTMKMYFEQSYKYIEMNSGDVLCK